MDIVLIILGFIISIIGLIGAVIPALPGTPLNFIALLLLCMAKGWDTFSITFLAVMGIIAVAVSILDNVIPAWGAQKYGAEKKSVWLALAGTFIGMFFSPIGIIVGAFLGALIGELMHGKEGQDALRAGWGVFIGVFFGIILKLAASATMFFYFVKNVFN